ncbi:MAG TPA: inner membrane CreD family protein [Candidatus Elarobacter sp.]|nr:inner membrane CreD family protein [Candidatus Elarobacter sp.]
MAGRLSGIALVLVGATIAWFVLGATLGVRTASSDLAQRDALSALWGSAQEQSAPGFSFVVTHRDKRGRPVDTVETLATASSRVAVDLALDERRKGLLWYNTYAVRFAGTYRTVPAAGGGRVTFSFAFPSEEGTYEDVGLTVDGRAIAVDAVGGTVVTSVPVARGKSVVVSFRYRSHGLGSWSYRFGSGVVAARDLLLTMRTNFKAIDFPPRTLAPAQERPTADGWVLTWRYGELIGGSGIGMAFPQHLQPGPLAERLTLWAPVSLLFYVFVMVVITTLRKIDLHPINYFFLAAAFFAFHLLFAYTIDRIRVEYAFVLCSVVSMALTVSYLRLVVGLRFAAVEAALAQFFYLILFSFALFDEGWSGLSITIGAIATLFVTMQVTARIDWSARFALTGLPKSPASS